MKKILTTIFLIFTLTALISCGSKPAEINQELAGGLTVESALPYSGAYVEDGSDTDTGCMAIKVTNTGNEYIQYAVLSASAGDDTYTFEISTLMPGDSVTALNKEKKKMPANAGKLEFETVSYAPFGSESSVYPDIFDITAQDGQITVRNISDKDIDGEIYVYYKNLYEDGSYLGGITYRAGIRDGLAAGAEESVQTEHYGENSRVVFVTYVH